MCAASPFGMRESGGLRLDADQRFAYIGVRGGDVGQHLPAEVEVKPAFRRAIALCRVYLLIWCASDETS